MERKKNMRNYREFQYRKDRVQPHSMIWKNLMVIVIMAKCSGLIDGSRSDGRYMIAFQEDGRMSNESWALLTGFHTIKQSLSKMTTCYWFKISYHHATMTIGSYCSPGINCIDQHEDLKCSNIQFHIDDTLDWKTLRVEYSVSNVKTKTLRMTAKPKSWNHQCLVYEDGKISLYGSGYLQSQSFLQNRPIMDPYGAFVLGQEQEEICKGYDAYDSFSGYLTELHYWDRALNHKEILDLAECKSFMEGNILNWNRAKESWKLSHAKILETTIEKLKYNVCPLSHSNDYVAKNLIVFPERRDIENAKLICEIHGGTLPVPLNMTENQMMANLSLNYEGNCLEEGKNNIVQPYTWLGIHSTTSLLSKNEVQIWINRNTNQSLNFQNWEDDEGNEGDTCARMQGNGKWRDTVCKKTTRHCTICDGLGEQVYSLRGLCRDTDIDRKFILVNKHGASPTYEGLFSQIRRANENQWVIESRLKKGQYFGYANITMNSKYPIGRHEWLISDTSCDQIEPIKINLTLSRCTESEFTCANGFCVSEKRRCDFAQDCRDLSDELGCDTVILPDNYLKEAPPCNQTHPESPLKVALNVNIMSIDRIDTVHMMFGVTIEVHLVWKDHRLSFKNLRSGTGQNQLSNKEIKRIWKPDVSFCNAKIGTLKSRELGVSVKKENQPLPFDYSNSIEDKIYLGADNPIILARKVYVEYGCPFNLRSFPFDTQKCALNFTLDSAESSYLVLEQKEVVYHGEMSLLEFFLNSVRPISSPNSETALKKSMVSIGITFHRELGNMVNTFFQTFLLCLMAYLTLYINITDFANRFMGALTSLLVLASLLASIEENLPKTSYCKNIDIWFMGYIIFIFIIIVFHIWVDFYTGHRNQVIESQHILARQNKLLACRLNNLGKTVFPIILFVFTTLYFIISMSTNIIADS